ncbi:MAG: oligosaccharide flippase family protein [Chloroflexi bacterium]|nr:oligosaccharide flippase family protein [Chloroflexota bacterium]
MIASIRTHLRSTLIVNTYLLFFIRLLGTGFGFLFWAVAARAMTAEQVGLASGTVSSNMLLAGLAQLGLGYGLVRHLAHSKKPNALLNIAFVITGGVGVGLAILFLLMLASWSPALLPLRDSVVTMLLFVLFVAGTSLSQMLHWAFMATRQLTYSLIKNVTQSFLAIVLLFIFRPIFPGYLGAVMAYTGATVVSLLIVWIWFLPKAQVGYRFNLDFSVPVRASFARFSLVNYVTDQFQRAPDTLLPLIVINLFGTEAGAYFFVVWTLGRSMSAWAGSIAESLFAEGSHSPARLSLFVWRAAKFGLLLSTGLAAAISIGGRLILSIYGAEYATQGMGLLYFVAATAVPTVLLSVFVNYLRVRDKLRAVFVIMTASIGLGMVACYVSMQQWGLIGAGMGWLGAQTAVLLSSLVWWQWHKNREEIRRLGD